MGGVSNSKRGSNRGILGNTVIGNISNISINIVGVVVDSLGPSVWESNTVGASLGSKTIRTLGGSEGGARIVIRHGVVKVVGGDLGKGVSSSISTSNSNRSSNGVDQGGTMQNRGGSVHKATMDKATTVHKATSVHKATAMHEATTVHKATTMHKSTSVNQSSSVSS